MKIRTWNGNKYTYTAVGKKFFKLRKSEYLVEIPVKIIGRRESHGRGQGTYERTAYMPVSHFWDRQNSAKRRNIKSSTVTANRSFCHEQITSPKTSRRHSIAPGK